MKEEYKLSIQVSNFNGNFVDKPIYQTNEIEIKDCLKRINEGQLKVCPLVSKSLNEYLRFLQNSNTWRVEYFIRQNKELQKKIDKIGEFLIPFTGPARYRNFKQQEQLT